MKVDVCIIGGGIGGLMAAYRLTRERPEMKVAIVEKGKPLNQRKCPILEKEVPRCIKCPSCAIMEGMAGAGAFSDGKYGITTEYGGWLTNYLEPETVLSYIEQADNILVYYGATTERFMPSDRLKKLCLQNDLHMSQAQVKHLGTDCNLVTMGKLIDDLKCDIYTETEVVDVDCKTRTVVAVRDGQECSIQADAVIFAVGRVGSGFFADWCGKNGIGMENNQVDIGLRVELPAAIWADFAKEVYEPKIWSRSKRYGDVTRTFCFNDRGSVVTENTDGIITVNGHAYREESRKTENSNFALLSTTEFTQPFRKPIAYAKYIASLANLISGGSILVQRLGDLINGKRSNARRMRQSTTRPTLQAVPGDLSLCMPKRQLDNIIETLYALDKIAPGTANYDTLLYGVECKYYSARPNAENFLLDGCEHIYAVGDGAGFTRSLAQAAANGLYVADLILGEKA